MAKRILVVDDESDIALVLVRRLEAHGYEVSSAADGDKALRIIMQEKFDLILLDILMPGKDGVELAQILGDNPKTKDIPIIFLTALGVKQKDGGYTLAGTDVVFAKPYDFKELEGKITELLGRKS